MKKQIIITIAREFGSGGREIGLKLAEKLNIPLYDKELISFVAEKMQCGENAVEYFEEKAPPMFFSQQNLFEVYEMPMSDKIFIAQSEVIKELSQKSSCIIIGRCADYVLKDNPNCLNIFVYCDIEKRMERKMDIVGDVPVSKMKNHIRQIDKKRAKYYTYYTQQEWGKLDLYTLSLDSGTLGIDGCVDIILKAVEVKNNIE